MQPVPVSELEKVSGGLDMPNVTTNLNMATNVTTVAAAVPQVSVNVLGNAVQTNYVAFSPVFSLSHS